MVNFHLKQKMFEKKKLNFVSTLIFDMSSNVGLIEQNNSFERKKTTISIITELV